MKYLICAVFCMALLAAGCGLRDPDVRGPVTGGFAEASVEDEDVVRAAEFAASSYPEEGAFLSEIISAEQQVVAGINYRLVLEIESSGKTHPAKAVVWRRLSGEHELISWEPLK